MPHRHYLAMSVECARLVIGAFLVLMQVLYPDSLLSLVAATPPVASVTPIALAALGIGTWTIGMRASSERPSWFTPFGWVCIGAAMITGVAMLA